MNDYERQALHASALLLAAALLAYAATYVQPPGPDVVAVLAIAAVLLLAAYYFLDEPRSIAGAWVAPTAAAVVVLASDTVHDQQVVALALASVGVVGLVSYPVTASAAKLGERAGEYLR